MARTLSYQVGILTFGRMPAYMVMFFVPLVNVRTLSQSDYGVDSFKSLCGIGVLYFVVYALLSFKLGFIRWDDIKSIFGRTSQAV